MTPLDLVGPLQVLAGLEVVETVLDAPTRHHVVVAAAPASTAHGRTLRAAAWTAEGAVLGGAQ
jgi:hypothetical protein